MMKLKDFAKDSNIIDGHENPADFLTMTVLGHLLRLYGLPQP